MKAVGEHIGQLLLPVAGPEVYSQTPPKERAAKTITEIRKLQDILFELTRLARTLKDAGVKKESLTQIAQTAMTDAALVFNPVTVAYEDALELLKRAYE